MDTDAHTMVARKRCTRCLRYRRPDEFHAFKRSPDGLQAWCKQCRETYDRAYYRERARMRKEQMKQWDAAHPEAKREASALRRARGGAGVSRPTRDAFIAAIGECQSCGAREDLHVDHVVPLYAGGTDDPTNWQVLCGTDNRAKGTRTIDFRPGWEKRRAWRTERGLA